MLLGTVALEPNRWSMVDPSGTPSTVLSDWLLDLSETDFDGLELWERHFPEDADAVAALIAGAVPLPIFNSYVSFDDPDPAGRKLVADRVRVTGSSGVKFNVGNRQHRLDAYADRLAEMIDDLPTDVALLCECHAGISVAEDPAVAALLFDAAGPPDRLQAIVHTHESEKHLRQRFEAYGDRITHVHVNYLNSATMTVPTLSDRRQDLEVKASLLSDLGFRGSWTIEFVEGLHTDHDEPGALLMQASKDLAVLRQVLDSVAR